MKAFLTACGLLSMLLAPAWVYGQLTKSPQLNTVFQKVVTKASKSTVRVLSDGKEAALGVIVSGDGYILTKRSLLTSETKLVCRMPDGEDLDAKLIADDTPFDVALLKVDAKDLKAVEWCDSKKGCKIGYWVASVGPGKSPVAIGVVSVLSREVKGAKFMAPSGAQGTGYLGVALDLDFAGVKIQEILPDTPAKKAGLKKDDHILSVNGTEVKDADEFLALLTKFKAGDTLKLKLERDEKEMELKLTLGQRPGSQGGKSRGDVQNNMGSKLSDRRSGFPVILQHDSIILPNDCGGPLVNLEGEVIGINISRAGRTESYAIPSEAVLPLLEKLKKGKASALR